MTTTSIAAISASFIARPARIIVALLLVSALSGCGFLQLTYNNASMLVYRWLDGYAGFSDEQAPRVRAGIDRLHEWHRAHELPHYARLLERLAREAPADLNATQACATIDEARARLDRLLHAAQPLIAQIAADFRPEQLRHLERKFAETNRKYWKKWVDATPAQQLSERFERALQHAQRVYGTLDEPQLALIRAQLERSSFDPAATYAEMKRRQRDTLDTLRQLSAAAPQPPDAMHAAVNGWLDRMQRSPDPHYRAYQQKVERESCEGIAALHNGTTQAQRAHAARQLGAYARDLRGLATD